MIFLVHFHGKGCTMDLLVERLDVPKLHSLIQNDNQETQNLDWIAQREAGYFKLTAVPVKFFDLDFRSHRESESSYCWRAIRMMSQYRFTLYITLERSLAQSDHDIQNSPLCVTRVPFEGLKNNIL